MQFRFLKSLVPALALAAALFSPTAAIRAEESGAEGGLLPQYYQLQRMWDDAVLDALGGRTDTAALDNLRQATGEFAENLTQGGLRADWQAHQEAPAETRERLLWLGQWRGRAEQSLGLEMLGAQQGGQIVEALQWRSLIKLPKYANAVEGTMALHRIGNDAAQRDQLSELLAREYLQWQCTRVREKAGALRRMIGRKDASREAMVARLSELHELQKFPPYLLELAKVTSDANARQALEPADKLLAGLNGKSAEESAKALDTWLDQLEAALPNLLNADDVTRRETLLVKLLRLVPMEYKAGVRDGVVVIPIEYREAQGFTIKAAEMVSELQPVWRKTKAQALAAHGEELETKLADLEKTIGRKVDSAEIDKAVQDLQYLLSKEFQLNLRKSGTSVAVIEETVVEVRQLLGQSLQAAQAKRWREAESLRLEAYTSFDMEIEVRVMPRDPKLAIDAEKAFLDGKTGQPGIKAQLDARASSEALTETYDTALKALDDCHALLKVGLSPTTAAFTTFTIVTREGLEAVVILAALLAGLRGRGNENTRRGVLAGVWVALGATTLTFIIARYLVQSLSRFGERLEASVSIIAVIILLIVTNWVAHKYYWVSWNAKLQKLGRAAAAKKETRWEWLALVGVGFVTVYREGFETVLFLQTLLIEGGYKPVLIGLLLGGGFIAALGYLVFLIGAKLPYRKMLVFTGLLVVSILTTFLGSTVRLFQTVNWMPIHPITGLEIPTWMGTWLGLYPSIEGLIIPVGGLFYVGGAWFWVKISSKRKRDAAEREAAARAEACVQGQGQGQDRNMSRATQPIG